jgi:hypothetical protein
MKAEKQEEGRKNFDGINGMDGMGTGEGFGRD